MVLDQDVVGRSPRGKVPIGGRLAPDRDAVGRLVGGELPLAHDLGPQAIDRVAETLEAGCVGGLEVLGELLAPSLDARRIFGRDLLDDLVLVEGGHAVGRQEEVVDRTLGALRGFPGGVYGRAIRAVVQADGLGYQAQPVGTVLGTLARDLSRREDLATGPH